MKINITKDKARFIVNEDARKVVCIIDHTSNLFLSYADQNLKIVPDCDHVWGRREFSSISQAKDAQ